jgi:hypothetical protein
MDYFSAAMSMAIEKLGSPRFFIFSDDINWCEAQFGAMSNTVIVGHEHKGIKFGNYLQLMACCKHFIIPNSTFAWWAVWLANRKDNLVIAPQKWLNDPTWDTKDLIPDHWIRMAN